MSTVGPVDRGPAQGAARGRLPWRLGALAPSEHCMALAELGYDFLEIGCDEFRAEVPEEQFGRLRRRLAGSGLRAEVCAVFLPRDIKLVGPRIDWDRFTASAEVEIRRAAELGAQIILWGNAPARTIPDGYPPERAWDELVRAVRHAAEVAERHGVQLVFEPMSPAATNLIQRLPEGLEFVRRAGQPRVRVAADMFHMAGSGERWDALAQLGDALGYVHLSDHDRHAPGGTEADLPSYAEVFRHLQGIGYTGRVSIEANWGDLPREAGAAIEALALAARHAP